MTPNPDCIFCKIVSGDIPANRIYEDDATLAFPDLNPQAPAHFLVIPKLHLSSLADATPKHGELLGELLATAAEVARQQSLDNGYRVIINTGSDGGQTVSHLHLHVLGKRAMHWPPG